MELHHPRLPRTRHGALPVVAAAVLAAGVACSSQQRPKLSWPPPPETARIELVRSFSGPDSLDPGTWRKILNAILPHDSGAAVLSPSGLALSPDEKRLYVACGGQARILVVDRDARSMSVLSLGGSRPATTIGVALDASENLYASDRNSNSVFVYDRSGKFLRRFGSDVLEGPSAIAVDRRGQLLYVISGATSGTGNHRIEEFSLAGKHLRTLGKRGDGPGEFNFPTSLFVGPDGTLFVADMLNFRVQQLDANGQVLGSFGKLGTGMPGAFDKIKGVAIDRFSNIYVVDSMQGVHILNSEYRPLMLFGSPPVMATPGPIVIDSTNRIFVADFGLNAIHEYQLVNTTAADSRPPSVSRPAAPASKPTSGKP